MAKEKYPDCYFFVNTDLPKEEQKMSVVHVECHDKEMAGVGWFYRGSVEGYGPFDYICEICGHVIYAGKKGPNADKKENKASS